MAKISYDELEAKLMDPGVPDKEIASYLRAVPAESGPFNPSFAPDPAKVAMDARADFRVESAMQWGNRVSRWRRRQTFEQRLETGPKLPVLVSEGDSWFQFPFLLDDVVDQLGRDHLIWSLDAAGDTAHNMVHGNAEYMKGLLDMKAKKVQAFLFSAAGNDVIGADENGNPMLARLLKPFQNGKSAASHIDQLKLGEILTFLEGAYSTVVATIRKEPAFKTLPIVIHGYDYVIPGGFPGDKRNPVYASQDQWLGRAFKQRAIVDVELQREIIRILVDALHDMLSRIAGNTKKTHVHLVDVRGTLKLKDWADEIHPTDDGFAKVAKKFRATLKAAGVG